MIAKKARDTQGCAANLTFERLRRLRALEGELEAQIEFLRQERVALGPVRDHYADLYEHAPAGYLTLSREAQIAEINRTGAALLGEERELLLCRSFRRFVAGDDRDRWRRYFQHMVQHGARKNCELALVRADGSAFRAVMDCLSVETGAGCVVRATFTDVSALKKRERERVGGSRNLQIAVQEELRRRLSSELHDRTSPNLAAIRINLSTLALALPGKNSPESAELLDDLYALIEDTTSSIREICADLRPSILEHAGLAAAIEEHVRQFSRRTGIVVSVHCDRRGARLEPDMELLLYRIFQEALTNCAKHAKATSIRVVLSQEVRPVVLAIADNGIGIAAAQLGNAQHTGGLGILNMREMAEFGGGRFSIESTSGKGTHIRVEI